jgi:hypothetical protein
LALFKENKILAGRMFIHGIVLFFVKIQYPPHLKVGGATASLLINTTSFLSFKVIDSG